MSRKKKDAAWAVVLVVSETFEKLGVKATIGMKNKPHIVQVYFITTLDKVYQIIHILEAEYGEQRVKLGVCEERTNVYSYFVDIAC